MKKFILFACFGLLVSAVVAAPVTAAALKKIKIVVPRNSVFVLNYFGARDAGIYRKHGIDLAVDLEAAVGLGHHGLAPGGLRGVLGVAGEICSLLAAVCVQNILISIVGSNGHLESSMSSQSIRAQLVRASHRLSSTRHQYTLRRVAAQSQKTADFWRGC